MLFRSSSLLVHGTRDCCMHARSNILQERLAHEWESDLWVCLLYEAKMPPWRGCFRVCLGVSTHLLLAQFLARVTRFLASCMPVTCMRSPTLGAMRFLRAGLMVFPWNMLPARCTLACSPGPMGRGMAEWNSPLKMLTRPWPRRYQELVYDVMKATMMMMMMSAFFSDPKVAASLPEQQLDWACPAFKWNLLAMTICYNHMDVL